MGISYITGSITKGKFANFYITKKINSYNFIPYAYGSDLIDKVFLKGIEQKC
jgi:imidazolonepropionase